MKISIVFHKVFIATLLVAWLFGPSSNADAEFYQTATQVGGPIMSDTTWTRANSPYHVIASIEVWEGVTLTIEPGVTVKFDDQKSMNVKGILIARGISDARITFTSSQTTPKPGDWQGIILNPSSPTTLDDNGNYLNGSILQHCVIEYAGSSSEDGTKSALDVFRTTIIDNCTIQNNIGRGLRIFGSTQDGESVISNSTIMGNLAPPPMPFAGRIFGGGIYASNTRVVNNLIYNNSASCDGGGIYAIGSTVENNTIAHNFTLYGGVILGRCNGGGIYALGSDVLHNRIVFNVASKGGGIYAKGSKVDSNSIMDNTASRWAHGQSGSGGGIYAETASVVGNQIMNNRTGQWGDGGGAFVNQSYFVFNTVIENSAETGGGILVGSESYPVPNKSEVMSNTVSGNALLGSGKGAGIAVSADAIVQANTVVNNVATQTEQGAGVFLYEYPVITFKSNTVVNNIGSGIVVGRRNTNRGPSLEFSNFYGNTLYDAVVLTTATISGTNNYWGTVESIDILNQVHDWYDDTTLGKLLYIPYQQEPSISAPVPPPSNLIVNRIDNKVLLSWDAIPSATTGYGYKIYYGTNHGFPPVGDITLSIGDPPVDVGSATEYYIPDLPKYSVYFFAVTAYDTQGRESWYSNVVQIDNTQTLYLPLLAR